MGPPALFATASGVAPSRDSAFDPQLTGGATSLEQSAQREVTRLHGGQSTLALEKVERQPGLRPLHCDEPARL